MIKFKLPFTQCIQAYRRLTELDTDTDPDYSLNTDTLAPRPSPFALRSLPLVTRSFQLIAATKIGEDG